MTVIGQLQLMWLQVEFLKLAECTEGQVLLLHCMFFHCFQKTSMEHPQLRQDSSPPNRQIVKSFPVLLFINIVSK